MMGGALPRRSAPKAAAGDRHKSDMVMSFFI
jgi:hypothetical protein